MVPDSAHLQASIDVLLVFKQGDKIIKFDKYKLQSPVVSTPRNFFDIKRYTLPVGEYQLEAQISDANLSTPSQYSTTFYKCKI